MDDFAMPQSVPLVASIGATQIVIGFFDSFIGTDDALFGKLNFYHDRDSQNFSNLWDDEANPMKVAFQAKIHKQAVATDRDTMEKLLTMALEWELNSVRLI